MKISIVKESLCLGGTERSAANISVALAKQNEVEMVLYDGKDIHYQYGGTLVDMKTPPSRTRIGKMLDHFRRVLLFSFYLQKNKPDIVYLFISYRHPLYRALMRRTIKIISARDFSALSNNMHSFKKSLNVSDALICNSEYMREYFLNQYPEDHGKVFAVRNIIDMCEINKQANIRITDDAFIEFRKGHDYVVVSVGRFCLEKAYEHLITAFHECRKNRKSIGLVLIGDGENKDKYIQLTREYGIENDVLFTGFQLNPYQYMKQCDIFVLSSFSEGFPNVLAEALALSLPVISINCFSGPAEVLRERPDYSLGSDAFIEAEYGILVPHYDMVGTDVAINEMAKAIQYIIENKTVREKYIKIASEGARRFSAEDALIQFSKIFAYLKEKNKR